MNDYSYTNIVPKDSLRKVQLNTLNILASVLSKTAGPRGSNTQLIHSQRNNEYTKDGHNVLSEIKFYRPLENAIQSEMKEITRYIVKTVGDGTTSAVLLSNEIFKSMCEAETTMSAYSIMKKFKEIVNEMIEKIHANKKECTLEDIYNICMIATNGNVEVSESITDIYKEFGMEVFIDVGVSNTTDHLVKSYDGLTLDVGYPAPAYINTPGNSKESGKSSIRNPKIYAFEDPIDTPEMFTFLETIVYKNILEPIMHQRFDTYVPTVILAPSISRDGNKLLTELEKTLYGFDQSDMGDQKPPILIIVNANVHHEQFDDINMLCGTPTIRKFIDPDVQKAAIERGDAPTPETICDWCGSADLVEADTTTTKFVNPKCMFEIDETGNRIYSSVYNGLINYINQELDVAYKNNEDANVTGKLKRRLNSLKTNLVEYLIGGITVTDRDSIRDLVEDAVLNCRSAAKNGVGYGANFEAYKVINDMCHMSDNEYIDADTFIIKDAICNAYYHALLNLYMTVFDNKEEAEAEIVNSIEQEMPLNLATMEYDGKVLCSIETDVAILEAISKVVMVMFTANQALIESPINNVYLTNNEGE